MTFIVASKSGVALVATGSLFIYAAGGLSAFFAVNGIAFFTFDFIFCMPISFGFPGGLNTFGGGANSRGDDSLFSRIF